MQFLLYVNCRRCCSRLITLVGGERADFSAIDYSLCGFCLGHSFFIFRFTDPSDPIF